MSNDAISVVMPTHNRAHLISRAVTSCLEQLDERDELIIIDDGSTDETGRVVGQFGNRVKYIKTPNHGAGAARNRGIREAKNPLIAFLDSDDEWLPGKVKIQRAFMQAMPDILFCFSNFSFKEAEALGGNEKQFVLVTWTKDERSWDDIIGVGKPISSVITLPTGVNDFKFHVGDMYLLELRNNYISVITLMVRREEAGDALRFAEDTPTYEDWEFFGRITREGKGAYLDIETACQHSHGGTRLTDSHITDCAAARVKITECVWGKDSDFLEKHGSLYMQVLDEQRLLWIEGLIARGDVKKAREQIKLVTRPPNNLKILTFLPNAFVRSLLYGYRLMKKLK